MASPLRLVLATAILGFALSACGGGAAVDEAPAVAATPGTAIEDSEILRATFMATNNQAEVASTINDARRGGNTDTEIAKALGEAYQYAPRRRVMFSVNFIHFREGSSTPAAELDAAYEEGRTPAAEAAAQARADARAARLAEQEETARAEAAARVEAERRAEQEDGEEAEEDEDEEPRQRGWRRWVPGL